MSMILRAVLSAVFVAALTMAAAAAPPTPLLAQKAPEAATISQIAQDDGHVRVIVEFASPIAPDQITPEPTVLTPLKAQIAATQDAIIETQFGNALTPREGQGFPRALYRFDITPMFAVNVSQTELEALASDPRVLRIHYDRQNKADLTDSVPLIGMTGPSGAYALGATGLGQAVAVVDTGVQSNHEFLTGKVVAEACFSNANGGGGGVSLCPNGQSSQSGAGAADPETAQCINGSTELCQHGTHVAGIAAGNNTSQGVGEPPNGVAKDAKIVAVQVFTRFNTGCNGSPPCITAFTSDIIAALNWIFQNAVNLPGNVKLASANMSLGNGVRNTTFCDSDPTKPSIDNLKSAGVATAIAAGNESYVDGVAAPGCISTAITVASSTKQDVISSFSDMASMVDLVAPGSSIQSSIPVVPHSTTTYSFFNGTSMATPHVAGAFAAIRTACPTKTVDQIETALENTGTPITDTRTGGTQTKPRIRVDLAVQQLACSGSSPTLAVSPASNIAASGNQGGPFAPASFSYQLSATTGSVNYSISGVPSWLTASSPSGTVTTSATTVTFTVNSSANALGAGTYSSTITFTNTTNGQGTQTRTATLTVNAPTGPANDNFGNAITIGLGQTKTGTNVGGTKEVGEPNLSFNSGGKSVWWNWRAPSTGPVKINTLGSNFDTILGVFTGSAVNALTLVASNDDMDFSNGVLTSQVTFTATAGTIYRIMVDGFNAASGNIQVAVLDNSAPGATSIVTAVAPAARTTTVGTVVTGFATIINAGAVTATSCSIALPAGVPANFLYQTTNPATNTPVGTPNTPVNIGAGAAQTFYFAITPTAAFSTDIALVFDCTNSNPAAVVPGLNTFLVTASASAVPDMLSIADTLSHDGKIGIAGTSGTGLMVVAAINIGAAGTVTFIPTDTAVGQPAQSLPLTLTICQTNPSTGACVNPTTPGNSSTVTVSNNQTVFFSIFVRGQGKAIPYDPANTRIFSIASQSATPVGEASAAVNMQ